MVERRISEATCRKLRTRTLNKCRRTCNPNDYIDFKASNAKFKKVTRQTQKYYWSDYCSTVTKDSSVLKIWRTLKKMNIVNQSYKYSTIEDADGSYLTDPQSKANAVVAHVADVSSDNYYSNTILQYKSHLNSATRLIDWFVAFSEGLQWTLHFCSINATAESSTNLDRIKYTLLKNLSDSCLCVLLILLDTICCKQPGNIQW